jgi:hypothetical protein
MLRHYSTNRVAVLTIAIPLCVGIFGWLLSTPKQSRMVIFLLVSELLMFVYALALSLFFSAKYEHTRRCLVRLEGGEDVAVYSSIGSTRLRGGWILDAVDRSLIVIGLVLHTAFYVYYFAR